MAGRGRLAQDGRLCCRRNPDQHLLLAHDECGGVVGGQFKVVTVGDGVGGAGLDTVSAEDAAVVVDVVDGGVAFAAADAHLIGVLLGLDVDAVGGAGGGAEEAADAFFQAMLIALEDMLAAEALLKLGRGFRVVLRDGGRKHLP